MMTNFVYVTIFLGLTFVIFAKNGDGYKIGIAMADITGPIAEITFMGYAKLDQKGTGLHTRQWSRAFIIEDDTGKKENCENRIVFVSADMGMMGDYLRNCVIDKLQEKFGKCYNHDNVILSGTHTHSTPGGFLGHLLFDLTSLGFSKQTFMGYCSGIARSIGRAHNRMQEGKIFYSVGHVNDANINRSPTAYENNPREEREKYKHNTDTEMHQLKFLTKQMKPIGVINWFAVHPTSMNNTNTLVSADNQGLACILFEKKMNVGRLIGKGPFVAAFASSNLGDVSPNTKGPRCEKTGGACERNTSVCIDQKWDQCVAPGPGKNMFDSTKIIAEKLLATAWDLLHDDGMEVTGPVRTIHQYKNMPAAREMFEGKEIRGCSAAMGYSFAAGTTDGPGAFGFKQSTTTSNPLWNIARDFLGTPTEEDKRCHAPKPILLATGKMSFPFEWQPAIVSTQLSLIGNIAIAAVPGEFTTMAGRRLRNSVAAVLKKYIENPVVIIAGLCNTYSDYITTFEEYQVQRYEGASTIYGPHTQNLYTCQYVKLATALLEGTKLDRGPLPPEHFNELLSLITPVVMDTPHEGKPYGHCTLHPKKSARPGETVVARFVSGNPRNHLKHEETFCVVERHDNGDKWTVVATDADWETKVHWIRKSGFLGTSETRIEYEVPIDAQPGVYRIRHFGWYKYVFGGVYPYEGACDNFTIYNDRSY